MLSMEALPSKKMLRHLLAHTLLIFSSKLSQDIKDSVDQLNKHHNDQEFRERRDKILTWLDKSDPRVNHGDSRRKHEHGTGNWFLESKAFNEWKTTLGSFLWLHGIPGAGKSIICSSAIEKMIEFCKENPESRLAYYYFDFSRSEKQTVSGLLQSLILQLCREQPILPGAIESLYENCHNRVDTPEETLLMEAFLAVVKEMRSVYVIIDALDECPERERGQFFELVTDKIGGRSEHFNPLVTSRKELDIMQAFNGIAHHEVCIQSSSVEADVRLHVQKFISRNKRLNGHLKEMSLDIEEMIVSGARGM
jgi:hypothetical protein